MVQLLQGCDVGEPVDSLMTQGLRHERSVDDDAVAARTVSLQIRKGCTVPSVAPSAGFGVQRVVDQIGHAFIVDARTVSDLTESRRS